MIAAIIPAAGTGSRMGSKVNKQFLNLGGMPVVARTLAVFKELPEVSEIILVFHPAELEFARREIVQVYGDRRTKAVAGGETRQESVQRGLAALHPDCDLVVIHDGARPLVGAEVIRAVLQAATADGAAIAAVPVKDTIKIVGNGVVTSTPPRDRLWAAQTPQAFRRELIERAHALAGGEATDDAALVEKLGHPVTVVRGSYKNIKITTPEDLVLAQAFLGEEVS